MARIWFQVFLKVVSITTLITSVAVIGVSSLTLVGIYKAGVKNTTDEVANTNEPNSTLAPEAIEVSESEENHWKNQVLPRFGEIKQEYKKILLGCIVAAIVTASFQLLSSLSIVLSWSKDVRQKLKYWLIVNLIVFLILLICFILPLTFSSTTTEGFQIHDITKTVEERIDGLKEKTIWENMVHELNAYFVVIGINEWVLLIFMILIFTCYCMKCGDYNYQPI